MTGGLMFYPRQKIKPNKKNEKENIFKLKIK